MKTIILTELWRIDEDVGESVPSGKYVCREILNDARSVYLRKDGSWHSRYERHECIFSSRGKAIILLRQVLGVGKFVIAGEPLNDLIGLIGEAE